MTLIARKLVTMILPKLGIDQSKETFDACLLDSKPRKRKFPNDSTGFEALSEWLDSLGYSRVHLTMESTGRYGNKLAQYGLAHGHIVSIVNPKRITHHRRAKGIRNKTDSNDAYVIADFARMHEPGPWHPPTPTMLELRDLVGQIELMKKHRTAYMNRSSCGLESRYVIELNAKLIDDLSTQIDVLEKRALAIVNADEKLYLRYTILDSVPGIGPVNALCLVSQIDFDQFRNGRDLASYLGLSPVRSQSGTTQNQTRTSKEGDGKLRALLKQGATSAKRSAFYKPFVQRLTQKGKKKSAITNAVARKMLLIAHACIRRGELFKPTYVHPLACVA